MTGLGQVRTNGTATQRVRTWGYSRRNQGKSGLRRSNVGCWGMSGRTSDMAGTSLPSHEQTQAVRQQGPRSGTLRCRWREPSTALGADPRARTGRRSNLIYPPRMTRLPPTPSCACTTRSRNGKQALRTVPRIDPDHCPEPSPMQISRHGARQAVGNSSGEISLKRRRRGAAPAMIQSSA